MTSCSDGSRADHGSGSPGPAPGLDYWWRGRESVAAAGGYPEMVEDAGSYHFISRPESPAEYRRRTGRAWAATGPPARRFRIQADYAEHDEKIGGGVHAFVDRDTAPSRAEAEQVAWPLIDAAVRGRPGPGDWRPSLSTIEMLWLIG